LSALKFALAGNPNSGKTTLFNELTGSTAHVGNWPGVTIDRREGKYKGADTEVDIIDLPGIYSLSPYTPEEIIARNYIIEESPDVIINIVDATNLERNLYLTTQLLETDCPVVVALNMCDQLEKRRDYIDHVGLEKKLGVPVVRISALRSTGMDELMKRAISAVGVRTGGTTVLRETPLKYAIAIVEKYLKEKSERHSLFKAVKIIEGDAHTAADSEIERLRGDLIKDFDDIEAVIADLRYKYITKHYSPLLKKSRKPGELTFSEKVDRVLTNKFLGLPIFMLFMYLIFHLTFGENLFSIEGVPSPGAFLQGGAELIIENIADAVSGFLSMSGASEWTHGLIVDGIIGGVGAVLSFVPQIMLVFFFLSVLEDSGYIARAAFIMDRLLRRFGLSGRSFMPMLMGFGCSVPSILATRTLESDRDRRLTMMLIPYMSCGAKMPIYALFAAALFKQHSDFLVFGMYILGIIVAVVSGIILKKTVFKDSTASFIMELPDYHRPRLKSLLLHLWEKLKGYIIKAGTIILVSTVIIWLLANFDFTLHMVEQNSAESILGVVGNAIKGIFIPLGFVGEKDGWKPVMAILTGIIAKEAVVSTLGVLYTGEVMESEVAGDTLIASIAGTFSPVAALSFMAFNLLSIPCLAALSALTSEMRSMKWTCFSIAFWVIMAWIVSFLVYTIGSIVLG
jgi:ferrous iron transport protein B